MFWLWSRGLVLCLLIVPLVWAEPVSHEKILSDLEKDPSTVLDPKTHVGKPEELRKDELASEPEVPVEEAKASEPEPEVPVEEAKASEPEPEVPVEEAKAPEPESKAPIEQAAVPPLEPPPVLVPEEPFTLQAFQEFLRKSPIPKDDLVLSAKTAEEIEFSGLGMGEISILGSLSPKVKLFVDGHPLSTNKELFFKARLALKNTEESHELRIEKNQESKAYPFKIKFEKVPPLPLRVRFKLEDDKEILKELLFQGVFASEEYIRLIWLPPETPLVASNDHQEEVCRVTDQVKRDREKPPSELDRAISAEFEKLQAPKTLAYREPFGLSVEQGIGFFSVGNVESKNWQVNVQMKRNIKENLHWEVSGSTFIVPFSVSGSSAGPRLFKLEAGVGLTHPLSQSYALSPGFGLRYQTLIGADSGGYQDLLGARISIGQSYQLGQQRSLHALASLALFNGNGAFLSTANREWGFKAYYQWGTDSSWVSSYYLGGEWTTLSLSLSGVSLSSSLYSGFLGVLF